MSVIWKYYDLETEERRRKLEQGQPRVKWNWPIVGAIVLGAALWAVVIAIGRLLV